MACIERRPRCEASTSSAVAEPISDVGSFIGTIVSIVGSVGGILKALEVVGTKAPILGVTGSGFIIGAVTWLVVLVVIGLYINNRCSSSKGLSECVAGVVSEIVQDFSGTWEEIFPFTAMHDRVDVVVKSKYWDVVEDGQAKVFCTGDAPPKRSEIMRCYFFTKRVCDAATGALYGAAIVGMAGVVAGALAAAAIGCATVILCALAMIIAALIVAAAALIGAFAGGQIAKAISDDTSPSDSSGTTIAVGDLITVKGNMLRKAYDEDANVLWWVESSALSGRMPDWASPNPFTYCEVDEVFTIDGCPTL